MTEKPYRLPDPDKDPASFLVILYKTLKKIEYNDRAWDRLYFPRGMKRANELLDIMRGNVKIAAQCMQELKDYFEGEGLSWTIETVIQYSFEWRSKHEQRNDRDCVRGLVAAYKNLGVKGILQEPAPERRAMPREPEIELSEEDRVASLNIIREAKEKLKIA